MATERASEAQAGAAAKIKNSEDLGQRLDASRKARQLAGGSIFVEHAFADAAMNLGLRRLQRFDGAVFVTAGDRGLHLLDEGLDPTDAGAIDCRAPLRLAHALFG